MRAYSSTFAQTSGMPSPVSAEARSAAGRQAAPCGVSRVSATRSSVWARTAACGALSALFTTHRSASSMIPRLMP